MTAKQKTWQNGSRVFDERAAEYDSWFDNSLLFRIEKAALQSLSLNYESPSLEIGMGPGRFAEVMQTDIGIDPALAPLRLARKRQRIPCQAIGEELPFRSSSLGCIFMLFTLCFLRDSSRCIGECSRVLQPAAPLVLGFIPGNSAWGKNLAAKRDNGHPFYQYATFYSVCEVKDILQECGFQITASCSTLFQPPEELSEFEKPRTGADEQAGFVIISASNGKPE